jgi:heme/copper-type cytochrome/quinol oxidase subunit 3
LVYRGVISSEDGLCIAGYGILESTQHLLLSCSTFTSLWPLVRDWIGVFGADSNESLFFSLFGFFVSGFYGLNVTIGCLIILLLLYLGCWTK